MKFIQAFEKIKNKIKNTNVTNAENFALQLTITNKDCGGIFYIQIKDGHLLVEPYDYRDNDAALSIMYGDLNKILEDRLDPAKAAEKGVLQVDGDTTGAYTVLSILKNPKASLAKTAKKKTLAK